MKGHYFKNFFLWHICFLWLLLPSSRIVWINKNWFCNSSGSQKSKIRLCTAPCSILPSWGKNLTHLSLLCDCCLQHLMLLGLQLLCSNLYLFLSAAIFTLCVCFSLRIPLQHSMVSFYLITCAKTLFPNKIPSWSFGKNSILGGWYSIHCNTLNMFQFLIKLIMGETTVLCFHYFLPLKWIKITEGLINLKPFDRLPVTSTDFQGIQAEGHLVNECHLILTGIFATTSQRASPLLGICAHPWSYNLKPWIKAKKYLLIDLE